MRPNKYITPILATSMAFLMPSMSAALNCDQSSFAGNWRGAGEGVVCDLHIAPTGGIRGACYQEAFDEARERTKVERIRVGGSFIISGDCSLSGVLEPQNGRSIPVLGESWTAATAFPDIARIYSEQGDGAELYFIRAGHLR